MSEVRDICLILWTDRFNEVVTVIFAMELRGIGLPVRLVKLPGENYTGKYGFTLTPDISLNDALALLSHVACIIVPTDWPALSLTANDPRIGELLQRARRERIEIVTGVGAAALLASGDAGGKLQTSVYTEGAGLFQQASQLAQRVRPRRTGKRGVFGAK